MGRRHFGAAVSSERIFDVQKREAFKIVDVDSVKPVDAVVFERRRERHVKNFLAGGRAFEQSEKGLELGRFGIYNWYSKQFRILAHNFDCFRN